MSSNCDDSIQYIPYKQIAKQKSRECYNKNKEIIKQKAKEYYYKNKEKKYRQDKKISMIHYHLKKKRKVKNVLKNGLKNNQLKSNKN